VAYRRTPRIQARLDAQRQGIVRAATALVSESGYAACSIARVAARAGVAPGTVYNHFASKGDVLADVFRAVVTQEVAAVRSAVTGGTAAERIAAVIETFAGRALKAPRLAYALLAEPVDARIEALRLQFRQAFCDIVANAVADGVAQGQLPPQNPAVTAAALVGAIGEVLVGPLDTGAAEPDTVPTLIGFALRGIGALDDTHA
jgi:AcrR family transcriptional regulator